MARIVPAALAAVCALLMSPNHGAYGWAGSVNRSPRAAAVRPSSRTPLPFTSLAATVEDAEETTVDMPTKSASLDHEHADAPTYDPFTDSAFDRYKSDHAASVAKPAKFWAAKAREYLKWYSPFDAHAVSGGGFEHGDVRWFSGGKLNVCYNAIDRWVDAGRGDEVGMVWEGDEPDDVRELTYDDMMRRVGQIANALKSQGVGKGDVVTIYMPMIPDLPLTMLACARIGAVHSVVFAGFSARALAQRVGAAKSKFLVTADRGVRGTKSIPLKGIVDEAIEILPTLEENGGVDCVEKVMVWERYFDANEAEEGAPYEARDDRDVRMDVLVNGQRPYCPPEWMDAEDELFILYTSGSTGTPKGLVHTTGGYAVYAAFTTKTTFDLKKDDLFACVADCGWITGHTYVVYGPLLNGGKTFVFESTPMYPDAGRYWDMVQRHGITQFYTAPTAIRSLMRFGTKIPSQYDLSSLRILGSVGEPINPEAWRWYYENIGKSKCTVVDTYWQTETGGHLCTNIPGVTPMKPGSCTLPMYGIDAMVLDPVTGEEITENNVEGVLAIRKPWPGMARTCLGDHERYMKTYLRQYKGYYFTDDAVYRDKDGYIFITGRCDDVLNVSGHRIGTAEIESALVSHPAVAQSAVVGRPHEVKGQSVCAFATLVDGYDGDETELIKELVKEVRADVGPFAAPDLVVVTPGLPMTRSGKIMRRILRKIVTSDFDGMGDTSTLADPSVVDDLVGKMKAINGSK